MFDQQGYRLAVDLALDPAVAADPELYVDPPWVITISPSSGPGGNQSPEDDAPAYVHRILDAFLTGSPLNFGALTPPPGVRRRLDEALADGTLSRAEQ